MNRRLFVPCLAIALLLPSLALAQLKTVIEGPKQSAAAELIVLDSTKSEGLTKRIWKLLNSDKTFLPVDHGERVVFSTGTPGRYTFMLIGVGKGKDMEPDAEVAEFTVTVGRPVPPTPPGPTPGPVIPAGEYGLAKIAYDAAMHVSAEKRSTVVAAIADNFEGQASKLAAVGDWTVVQALAALKSANQAAAGSDVATWTPVIAAFATKMQALKLETKEQHGVALREFAEGLRLAADQL